MTDPKPQTISEYIHSFPQPVQEKLNEILDILRKIAPEATEELKWGQPALSYDWILFQFAAFTSHISLYPTPQVITAFEKELTEYDTSSSTVKFPIDKPLPKSLIADMAKRRVEDAKNGIKWK